ncbi:hypothetical protein [Acetivibrio mesophilus]|uniref:Uncharacterized protein n=1 Tax=Acetivibrio mesophilus TaxID=2487273 RepID=A0A4Q0I5E4_9FIRM|nr:hypothetical protein [Acetivibrio mesophilus]ODM25890.1 hypothetical protein A7W90_06430 [Clostridium sp. Bc-iso-3]RXE59526.1 hypothetical protein EFD62_06115 [Acetivibrio mesophilus]HHV30002.1 hypothetical protein [Clostridium sp.]
MAEETRCCGDGNFPALLSKYIGETVTIFTKSGGQSGAGFTGVILAVNECFVRLITRIGPPPACSLGNACSNFNVGYGYDHKNPFGSFDCGHGYGKGHGGYSHGYIQPASEVGAISAGGWNGYPVYTVGSVTDIPISAIVSFVHNAV